MKKKSILNTKYLLILEIQEFVRYWENNKNWLYWMDDVINKAWYKLFGIRNIYEGVK